MELQICPVSQFSLIVSQKPNGGAKETKEWLCRSQIIDFQI